jgi:hypothetical protein
MTHYQSSEEELVLMNHLLSSLVVEVHFFSLVAWLVGVSYQKWWD